MVRTAGLEPAFPFEKQIFVPLRLSPPPNRRSWSGLSLRHGLPTVVALGQERVVGGTHEPEVRHTVLAAKENAPVYPTSNVRPPAGGIPPDPSAMDRDDVAIGILEGEGQPDGG